MSKLKDYRKAVKAELVSLGVFAEEQIIIDRQADEWTVIADALSIANSGIALHIAEANGTNADPDADDLDLRVDIVITIFCEPVYTPEGETTWPEDDAWERMVKALHGKILMPETNSRHCYDKLRMISWQHVPNEFQYYARATTFRAPIMLVVD